jgi:hypothetical protein
MGDLNGAKAPSNDDWPPVMDWRPLVYGALFSIPFWIGLCIWLFF